MARLETPVELPKHQVTMRGLIWGFAMLPDRCIQNLVGSEHLDQALTHADWVVWLHFNARIGQARNWIHGCEHLQEPLRGFLLETDERKRIEQVGEGYIGVLSDIRYDFDFDPDEIATLRFYLDRRCLISTRLQPSNAADQLRTEIRQGRYFDSTAKLLLYLFESQVAKLTETTSQVRDRLDDIEDQVLAGQTRGQHVQLGMIRRQTVRLHHHFAPEHRMLQRLCRQPPDWFEKSDRLALQEVAEEFRELINDMTETLERAKLLQEELSARVAEKTGNNLYILSIFTALLLPPSLMAGIFGMNVAGLPGLQDENAFLWIMLGMAAVSLLILLALHLRRLL
jgi:zinc transporter